MQEISPKPASDDGTMPADYALARFYSLTTQIFQEVYGFNMDYVQHLPADLQRQGFVNVERQVFHVPIGDWPRDPLLRTIGGYMREVIMDFAIAVAARPFVEFGMEKSEIDDLLNAVRDALADRRIHAYLPIHYVWGQKPLS